MTPIVQTKLSPPDGDCMQACVAALFDLPLEDVPNFILEDDYRFDEKLQEWKAGHDDPVPKWWGAIGEFAADRGFVALDWPHGSVGYAGAKSDILAMATIKSPRGPYSHCVVAEFREEKLVMDPYPGTEQDRYLMKDELQGWTLFVKIGP